MSVSGSSFRPPSQRHPERNRWAIIVGITEYQDESLNLAYAHRDAEELYNLLLTPAGGAFEPDNICLLTNPVRFPAAKEATRDNILAALRSFLKKPAKEDLVLIYFACHGAPDPDRRNVVYLLGHDTDPADIAATAIPMSSIKIALSDNLHAERVVLIADTCHSAAVGGDHLTRGVGDAAIVNAYLDELGKSTKSFALLSSAETNESSLEAERWGGGHGVFTHFLLEGLRGKAQRNGVVPVGVLFEYVRREVIRETGERQHPVIGNNDFDRDLPLAIVGGLNAREDYRLGCCLNQLGWLLNEPERFEYAKERLQEALATAHRYREKMPEALFQLGLADASLGHHDAAAAAFRRGIEDDEAQSLPELHFHLGLSLARLGRNNRAINSLRQFLALRPASPDAQWIRLFIERIASLGQRSRQIRILLIGISEYADSKLTLKGPANDIRRWKSLLSDHYQIPSTCIETLQDRHADQEAIMKALARLASEANAGDQVLFYFSGHAHQGDEKEQYLIPYDYQQNHPGCISARQLHDFANAAADKQAQTTVIVDSHATAGFVVLANRDARYRLMLGTSPEMLAYESLDTDAQVVGQFTHALVTRLAEHEPTTPLARVLQGVTDALIQAPNVQEPIFIDVKENFSDPLLENADNLDEFLDAHAFSMRQSYADLDVREILDGFDRIRTGKVCSFPQLELSYGRALLEKKQFHRALEACLGVSVEHGSALPEADLYLSMAKLHTQDYRGARSSLQEYAGSDTAIKENLKVPLEIMQNLGNQCKHALVVGIDRYPAATNLRGACNDARLIEHLLVKKFRFAADNVTLLLDDEASRDAIERHLTRLLQRATDEPALFYFAGYGSHTTEGDPTLVPADHGLADHSVDITFSELAAKAKGTNLVTILDAGWQRGVQLPWGRAWGSRFLPRSSVRPFNRGLREATPDRGHAQDYRETDLSWGPQRDKVTSFIEGTRIGRVSIFHVSLQSLYGMPPGDGGETVVEAEFDTETGGCFMQAAMQALATEPPCIHGVLTHALVDSLGEAKLEELTYTRLLSDVERKLGQLTPFLLAENLQEMIFSSPQQEQGIHRQVYEQTRQEPIKEAVRLLGSLIERYDGKSSRANLNLGIALAALGEYALSQRAIDQSIEEDEEVNELPEARYYMGRILYERDDLPNESTRELERAVNELRCALKITPNHIPANYYFAQSLRALTERETLVEAEEAFRKYLDHGAPLGNRENILRLLETWSRRASATDEKTVPDNR
ncbi:caspase family protein [Granulosicoccus sp. 3-233]|uniref:caspase family protein n=1 Tax=Granulosicoccus sp. 3-233 TaxID=3417969 RepID=UPI003D330AB2